MLHNDYYKIYLLDSITGSTGNYAELDCEGIDFSTTFQVSDIADITTRKDAISKTISFKATKNNNIIFGNITNLNRYVDETVSLPFLFNFDITKDIDCQVYENDVLIFVGKLHFISTSRDAQGNINYDCDIEGYAIGLFQQIQNKLISDLDFSAFNHTFNIENVVNSWQNIYVKSGTTITGTTGEGYVYPCIDYGEGITDDTSFDNKFDYRNFRPAFYVKEYFNQIFNQTGLTDNFTFTFTGSTSFLEEFNKSIVPNNDSDFSYSVQPATIFGLKKNGAPQGFSGNKQTYYDSANNRTQYNNLIGFDTFTTGFTGQNIVSSAVTNGNIINFNNKINTTVTASVTFQVVQFNSDVSSIAFQCLYRDNDSGQFNSISEVSHSYPKHTNPFDPIRYNPITLNLSLTNTFEAGSEMAFTLFINSQNSGSFYIYVLGADVNIGSNAATSQVTIKIGDDAVLVGQNTQTLSQTDFITSFINMYNLYVYPDPNNPKNIIFIPYNDFYENFAANKLIDSSIDWTKKIDNSSFTQTPVTDIFDLYAFKFTDDSDYFSKLYSDKYGNTYGNLTLTGSTHGNDKSMDLIFASTPVASYANRNIPYLWELDTNNLKKTVVTKPRILFYNGLVGCPTYEIGSIALSASSQTYYFSHIDAANIANYTFGAYAEANEFTITSDGEFVDLTFGTPIEVYYNSGGILTKYGSGKKTLYDRYYADYITELTDSNTRVVEVSVYLTAQDIQNLDFRRPIYFNSEIGHNYFKLLSVEYSNENEPATVRLQTVYINDGNVSKSIYFNEVESMYFTKSGCTSGHTGESILYTVPAGSYSSLISQTDANVQAVNQINSSGQTYVNTYGLCVNTGTSFSLTFGNIPLDAIASTAITTCYTDTGNLNTGSTIFFSSSGHTLRDYLGYYSDGSILYQTNDNTTIISTGSTSGITATTYTVFFQGSSSQYLSCQAANDPVNDYVQYNISDPSPQVGTVVTDMSFVLVPDGWYATKFFSYQTVSGIITNVYTCNNIGGGLVF